jgi:hypothetical protein
MEHTPAQLKLCAPCFPGVKDGAIEGFPPPNVWHNRDALAGSSAEKIWEQKKYLF